MTPLQAEIRRQVRIAAEKAAAESASEFAARKKKLDRGNAFLRVIIGGKTGAYDMGPKDDPDGIFVTLRD